ncbi:MAG: hypothetical protein NT125_00400, partial [Candidatus Bipolaricaulota bacterium]|nr:hypothetical protein [Candidatus Bipolaricaulota bacterium]
GLAWNNIYDVEPLAKLTLLEDLDLSGDPIADIRALVENPGLGTGDRVTLVDTQLVLSGSAEGRRGIETLRERGVTVIEFGL